MKQEVFLLNKKVRLFGDEYVNVHIKEARIIDEANNIGDFKGQIDIVYPFAGYDLDLTLDIHIEKASDDWIWETDAVFRVPFSEEIITLNELYHDSFHKLEEKKCRNIIIDYGKCSCGGSLWPMYDEFPRWIHYCDSCDTRQEEPGYSPLAN
ncbi:hypothetical protein M3202_19755 [Alkalihalobacillus oceani]|uniref:Uncharacterized protein n=1 Tax=Halalkalibacter oceani TaxID=1653776 RepID=A0A9X2DTW2_9BACI|nr:hypothetical protein [Halalkalibacter oceani]MCM3716283.1 hypothetical protein [Halalkalibacter oceani]